MSRFIRDIKKYRKYIVYSAKSGLKSEVAGSHLGWIWWVLEPLMFMLVYWFIFAVVFSNKTEYFPIYVFLGLTVWNFFNKSMLNSVKIIVTNKGIISKVYLPKYTLVMVELLQQAFKMAISLGIVVILMIIYRVPLTWNVLMIIPVLLTTILFTFGISSISAHFGVFVEDLKTALNVILRVIFYLSGVFYELVPMNPEAVSRIPKPLDMILLNGNPVAFLMNSARKCLVYGQAVNYLVLAVWFLIGVGLAFLGVRTIYKYENSYVKVI